MSTPWADRIAISRVWVAGGAAFLLSLIANALVRILVKAVFPISHLFAALQEWQGIIFLTFVGVLGATVVFAILARLTKHAIRVFRGLALILLLLSFIPNILMLTTNGPGATIPAVGSLMVMHVITAGITVWLLTTWPRVRM